MPMGELLLRGELIPQHVLQLFTLQLSTPALPPNGDVETESQIISRLEAEVERHINRKPDDPDADQILALKQHMSWSRLAEYLSKKEGRKVSVDKAKQ